MALGSMVVDLLMRTGSFSTYAKQAERRLKELGKEAKAAGTARCRAIRAQELVERTAAGRMGWLDLTDRLAALRAVYQRAPRREGAR